MSCWSVNSFDFAPEKLHSRWSARANFSRTKSNELTDQQNKFYHMITQFKRTEMKLKYVIHGTAQYEYQIYFHHRWVHNLYTGGKFITLAGRSSRQFSNQCSLKKTGISQNLAYLVLSCTYEILQITGNTWKVQRIPETFKYCYR